MIYVVMGFSWEGLIMTGGKSFSRREWILLVVILLLMQFIVHWLSLKYGSSVSALGYVSFAGTVVSILLGLIAIIYAFVQSFTQANSVIEIREQVEKLIAAGDDIAKSKDDLHLSAVELGEITSELSNKINESILATKEVEGRVVKLSDAFASQKAPTESFEPRKEGSVSDEVRSVVNSKRIWLTTSMVAVAEGIKLGWRLDEIKEKLIIPVGAEFGLHPEFVTGLLYATLFALEAEGLIDIPDKTKNVAVNCKNDFLERLEKSVPRSKSTEYKQLASLWAIVDGLEKDLA